MPRIVRPKIGGTTTLCSSITISTRVVGLADDVNVNNREPGFYRMMFRDDQL
jgi:hypothetical protein